MSGSTDPKLNALVAALSAYGIKVQPVAATFPHASPNDTIVRPGDGNGISDGQGNTWSVNAAGVVLQNNKLDTRTDHVVAVLWHQTFVYHQNTEGNWWILIGKEWVAQGSADPRVAVPPTPKPTPIPTPAPTPTATPGTWIANNVNGTDYFVLLPFNYDSTRAYPVILFLHQLQNDSQIPSPQLDPWFNTTEFRGKHECIVVAPTCKNSSASVNWGGVTTDRQPCQDGAMAALGRVELQYRCDTTAVYVTGNSMGGIGCWDILYKYPDLFAAGLPIAGNDYVLVPEDVATKLRTKPIWAFHGSQDTNVPIAFDRAVYAAMQQNGGIMRYTELNMGHDVWDTVYPDPKTWDWLFAQKKGAVTPPVPNPTPLPTPMPTPVPTPTGTGLPLAAGYLFTSGNQIVDGTGVPQRIASVGWNQNFDNIPTDVHKMRQAGFNCMRVSWVNATMDADLQRIDKIVAAATANNMRVILDNHTNEAGTPADGFGSQQMNGLWYDVGGRSNGTNGAGVAGTVTDQRFTADWVTVAKRYTNNPTVVGFDIRNEPLAYDNQCTWGDSNSASDIRLMYQRVGTAIQGVNPGALIICEGPQNYNTSFDGTTQTPYGDLTGVRKFPVGLPIPNKVVYSVHVYPSKESGFPGADNGPTAIDRMNKAFGYLVHENIAPVWIGEMGASMDTDAQRLWADTLVAYMNGKVSNGPQFLATQQGIGGDWWAWGNLEGQFPDGTLDGNGNLRPEQQAIWKQLLFNA